MVLAGAAIVFLLEAEYIKIPATAESLVGIVSPKLFGLNAVGHIKSFPPDDFKKSCS